VEGLRARGYKIKLINFSRSFNVLSHFKSTWLLLKYFQKESFDVVHVHTPVVSLIARLAAYLAKTPCIVYTAHGFYFHENMNKFKYCFFVFLEIIFGKLNNLLFTQSLEDAESAVKLRIMSKDKTFAIGNGVNLKKFSKTNLSINKIFDFHPKAYIIGMIGRLVEEKGVVDFLDAARIASKENSNLYFILIGSRLESDHAQAVDDKIKTCKLDLGERLILTGIRNDIPQLLSQMNAFCLPSWREGMPRTIIEAMVMHLPVIATDIRGSREEVVHNKTGLLVPYKNPRALANAMCKLAGNLQLSKKMGDLGRKRALKYFDELKVINHQVRLIDFFFKSNDSSVI
jgi:glycosyltransferase involved in cell wall biosynthesis